MERARKEDLVNSLRNIFEESSLVLVTHYTGLKVVEIEDLRKRMRVAGASFMITKNRITRLAIEGTGFSELAELFSGPTAIAFSGDPVSAAKVVVDFSSENEKLVVIGGGHSGQILDLGTINQLAKLPSLDVLRAKIVSMINTPATRVTGILI